jgi:FdhD protein
MIINDYNYIYLSVRFSATHYDGSETMKEIKKVHFTKLEIGKKREDGEGCVVKDEVYEIYINDKAMFRLTIMPSDVLEAGIGFLIYKGFIRSVEDLVKYEIKDRKIKFLIKEEKLSMPEPKEQVNSAISVSDETITSCVKRLLKETKTWRLTGGVHAAALFDLGGEMLHFTEDIGKFNAIDKIIGKGVLAKTEFSKTILAGTGRIIGGMVRKAIRVGIPIVVSKGAPIYSGIKVAGEGGITLVCFAKGKKMNIYTHEERIKSSVSNKE